MSGARAWLAGWSGAGAREARLRRRPQRGGGARPALRRVPTRPPRARCAPLGAPRRATKRIACRPGVGGALIPRVCDAAALPGQSNQCGQDPYIVLPDRSECVDQQTLKMQARLA